MSGTARLISADLAAIAKRVLALAGERGSGIVTAESCTSGLLASALSEAPGAAQLLHGGFVTYTKANKTAALGIPGDLLYGPRGAVSPEVATAMAEGALARSPAHPPTSRSRSPASPARARMRTAIRSG
jgi:nicotinamide-nucleotide amidase